MDEYLTCEDDVIIKIARPNKAINIKKKDEDMLIPSCFFILKCRKDSDILPEYLCVFLNSGMFTDAIRHEYSGSTVKTLKLSVLENIEIPCLSVEKQKDIIKVSNLISNEKQMREELMRKKDLYYERMLYEMLGGK